MYLFIVKKGEAGVNLEPFVSDDLFFNKKGVIKMKIKREGKWWILVDGGVELRRSKSLSYLERCRDEVYMVMPKQKNMI